MRIRAPFVASLVAAVGTLAHGQPPAPAVDDRPVLLSYVRSHLSDVLHVYRTLTGRTVWLELGVDARDISVVSDRPLPRAEALSLIRRTLLETHHIEIREEGDRAFVARVTTASSSPRPDDKRQP